MSKIENCLKCKSCKYIVQLTELISIMLLMLKCRCCPGNFVLASKSDKQLPARSDYVYYGAHGYDPDIQDMKGIFFAKGPGEQRNVLFCFVY